MKYVMGTKNNQWHPCVFSEAITHLYVARAMEKDNIQITSAGFCSIHDGKVTTHSHSESLNMKPDDMDTLLLTLFLVQGLCGEDLANMVSFLAIQMRKGAESAKGVLPGPELRPDGKGRKKKKPRRGGH